jgi:hypothetical protein
MINVTGRILNFRKFLIDVWGDLDTLMEDHDWDEDGCFIDEWLQTNWEFLVERQLLKKKGVLSPFGMIYTDTILPGKGLKPTHEIVCVPKINVSLVDERTKKNIADKSRLVFQVFLRNMDGSFGLYPPFDYAVVFSEDRKHRYLVPVKDVEFFLDQAQGRDKS